MCCLCLIPVFLHAFVYLLKTNQTCDCACFHICIYVGHNMHNVCNNNNVCNIAYIDTSLYKNLVHYYLRARTHTHTSVCVKHVRQGIVQFTQALYKRVQRGDMQFN